MGAKCSRYGGLEWVRIGLENLVGNEHSSFRTKLNILWTYYNIHIYQGQFTVRCTYHRPLLVNSGNSVGNMLLFFRRFDSFDTLSLLLLLTRTTQMGSIRVCRHGRMWTFYPPYMLSLLSFVSRSSCCMDDAESITVMGVSWDEEH